MTTEQEISSYFSADTSYNTEQGHKLDFTAELQETKEYIFSLMNDTYKIKDVLDYAQRTLAAAEVVKEWRDGKKALNAFCESTQSPFRSGSEKSLPPEIVKHWNAKHQNMMYGEVYDAKLYHKALDDFYTRKLRSIFNDPEGEYLLAWNDFCHTGRQAPILHAEVLRRVASLLLVRLRIIMD